MSDYDDRHAAFQAAIADTEQRVRDASQRMTPERYGEIAYNAYLASTGGKSLVTGDELPSWRELSRTRPQVATGWTRAAGAVATSVLNAQEPCAQCDTDHPVGDMLRICRGCHAEES